MDLYYLIYTSVPTKPMDDGQLEELLNISREANKQFKVTGLLLSLPESFTQLIEGPKLHIEQLYYNIQKDKRHFRVTTLREGAIDNRFFPDWAMAFKRFDDLDHNHEFLSLQDEKVLLLFDIMNN